MCTPSLSHELWVPCIMNLISGTHNYVREGESVSVVLLKYSIITQLFDAVSQNFGGNKDSGDRVTGV